MASVETVLKHLYTFVSTLSKAHTEQVTQWDLKSLQNAFNWAKYAEEVYLKLNDRSFKVDLDNKIKDMTVHLIPVSCIQMDFDKLEKASEILFFTLIQNPHFPENISQDLFLLYNSQQDKFNFKLNPKSCALTIDNTSLTVGKDLMKTLHGPKNQDLEINILSQAKCLLDGLSSIISRHQDTHRSTVYIQSLLKRMSEVKHGVAVTIALYLQAGVLIDGQVKQEISKTVLDFLRQNIASFHNVPDFILTQASNLDFHFAELFTNWLIEKARTFSINYPDGELYIWACAETCDRSFSFQTLCKYFEILVKSNRQIKSDLVSLLKRYSEESLVNIFKDILKHLRI